MSATPPPVIATTTWRIWAESDREYSLVMGEEYDYLPTIDLTPEEEADYLNTMHRAHQWQDRLGEIVDAFEAANP